MATKNDRVRKRVWVQNVAVQATVLEATLAAIAARSPLNAEGEEIARGTRVLIQDAKDAAFRENPIPSRWAMWWRGTLIEAAYQNLHAAEALVVRLYNKQEVNAEIPEAVARVESGLSRDDPRRIRALALLSMPINSDLNFIRERLRKTIEAGYAQADQSHSRLRSFRNLILGATAVIALFMAIFIFIVALNPTWVPLCFSPTDTSQVCPTGAGDPSGTDVLIVALLGLLGGMLAGAVAISKLRGTATPYDVPTALALLKGPFGAMTAIGALIVIRGDFIPGLSELDSQVQILAYSLVFGYAQQLLTGLIDRQAQAILNAVPSKETAASRPEVLAPQAPDNGDRVI